MIGSSPHSRVISLPDTDRHRQARVQRERADLFAEHASKATLPETREMYARVALMECALADELERQIANKRDVTASLRSNLSTACPSEPITRFYDGQ